MIRFSFLNVCPVSKNIDKAIWFLALENVSLKNNCIIIKRYVKSIQFKETKSDSVDNT